MAPTLILEVYDTVQN